MKKAIEKRKPKGIVDYIALAITTFGVGYIPGAPGTYGALLAVGFFSLIRYTFFGFMAGEKVLIWNVSGNVIFALLLIIIATLSLVGVWAAERSIPLLGNDDPPEAVVDEVIGQLITLMFIPLDTVWLGMVAGFVLFRIFDIWKPYPINHLQNLSGGLGICADDVLAGIYAGVCLNVGYSLFLLTS